MKKFPQLDVISYNKIRSELRSGDILIASGEYMFSKLIQKATGSCWSHVAFVMRFDDIDRVMVFESVEGRGVRSLPLSEYVENFEGTHCGYKGRLAIARHKEFELIATPQKIREMAQFAINRFARPYDEDEILRITARIADSFFGFQKDEIERDGEYICSEYLYECYQQLGIKIKYNKERFVAPADFYKDKNIKLLWELEVIRD